MFDGVFSCLYCPREEVASILPNGLRLAPNVSDDDRHPVVFFFGEHTQGAVFYLGLSYRLGVGYAEMLIGVPFVIDHEGAGFYTYVPGMFCGYFPATWSGNRHYGYAKQDCSLGWIGPNYVVATEADGLVLRAFVARQGPWTSIETAPPGFEDARSLFEMPVLGHRGDGLLIESTFRLDFRASLTARAECSLQSDRAVLGISPESLSIPAVGSFHCRKMAWNLTWPTRHRG